MSDDSILGKPIGQLTPKERMELASHFARNLQTELQKRGFPSFDTVVETVNASALQFQRLFRTAILAFDESHRRVQESIQVPTQHGWYATGDMPVDVIVSCADLLLKDRFHDADRSLVAFYKKHQTAIERALRKHFPSREPLFRAAFKAHRRGEYELSIPIMLTQADGVFYDLVGTQFFQRRKGLPAPMRFAQSFASDLMFSSMLAPLLEGQISAGTKGLKFTRGVLNRHGILHGVIVDYASESNSFRAISLLSYLATTVREAVAAKPPDRHLYLKR